MKPLNNLINKHKSIYFSILITLTVLANLIAVPNQAPRVLAAGTNCVTSTSPSGTYTITACITAPANGATVSGVRNVSATVTTTGTSPGVAKLIFYLGGQYLLTDFQSPFTFKLPTTKWVDGNRVLEVEALMKDGFTSQRASISLIFNNGIIQPPVNNNSFTPKKGTTPPAGQPFTLVASGDGAGGLLNAGMVADMIASWNPNLFFYLGDVYEQGTPTEFYNWYGTSTTLLGRFRSKTDPVVGNHEYLSGGGAAAPGYFDYWDNVPNYYSFDAAGWHIIALNSNCVKVGGCNVNSAQYQWLANDLATHTNVCTIAFYHHPIFFVGPADDPQSMSAIWSLFAQGGVDLVLNGHDHNYQRWKPLNGTGALSSNGVTEFVVGGGGHGMQQFVRTDNRLAIGIDSADAFGALQLQLNQHGAGFQYVNTAGTMMDSGSVACSGAPADTTPPSQPTNLNATSSDSNTVNLSWKASIDNVGVTGYDIFRDGILLATAPPATSYKDTAVVPNTSYTYRIRARDALGQVSGFSSTVTVTTSGLLFSDGFESGNFSQWTSVNGLAIQQQQVYAGLFAVRGTSTGTPTYAYKQLSQAQGELYYRLWFKILSQGANSVYLQRFRTGTDAAIMGVFINSTSKLGYRNDITGISTSSTTTVASGVWHELQVHVRINGITGNTEVWLDGVRIDALSKTENLGTVSIGRIQLGENSSARTYDIALDRVALGTVFIDSSNPPEGGSTIPTATPTSVPVSTLTPTVTATLVPNTPTATPGGGVNTSTFTPVADAYVNEASLATNFGTATTLRADASPIVRSYLRFNVQGLSGTVARATLRVFTNSASSAGYEVRNVADNTWGELTINFTNAPGVGGVSGTSGAFATGAWTTVDITPLVAGNGALNVALTTTSSTAFSLASRESGVNAPQLIIETSP